LHTSNEIRNEIWSCIHVHSHYARGSFSLSANKEESRAITGRTARCRRKSRYVSKFKATSRGFHCFSTKNRGKNHGKVTALNTSIYCLQIHSQTHIVIIVCTINANHVVYTLMKRTCTRSHTVSSQNIVQQEHEIIMSCQVNSHA